VFWAIYSNRHAILERNAHIPTIPSSISSLSHLVFTADEVQSVLGCLPLGKASGPDEINNRVLCELSHELSAPLCNFLNKSVSDEVFLPDWKDANVCAIFKKGDSSLVSNYRPISLLSNVDKVLERLVFKHPAVF
jgi:hypothetical protein